MALGAELSMVSPAWATRSRVYNYTAIHNTCPISSRITARIKTPKPPLRRLNYGDERVLLLRALLCVLRALLLHAARVSVLTMRRVCLVFVVVDECTYHTASQ